MDSSKAHAVAQAASIALDGYRRVGRALPYTDVVINSQRTLRPNELSILVVKDASTDQVSSGGCVVGSFKSAEPLDTVSVQGGCFVEADDPRRIRCSADAVDIFSDVGSRSERANPALLYVLAHEFGHVYQKRPGDYVGRVEAINLWDAPASKLERLHDYCQPVLTEVESEADAMALEVMKLQLLKSPYRETVFTERGAMLWNTDQLALASNAWQQRALAREFVSQPKPHPAFIPRELPSPQRTIDANANQFVCDVLHKRTGVVTFPVKSSSHPPPEQRLRAMAVGLKQVADTLPAKGGSKRFEPVAKLQSDLSPIFTHIYRETGIYQEKLRDRICTIVNSAKPAGTCK